VDFVGSFGNDDTITIKATYEDWIVIADDTTTRCLDCGVDTEISGYVNRVPADKAWIDGYICGPCGDTFDGANDDGDDPWDALDAYLPARIAEVDNADPTAAEFRRWFKRQDGEERTSGQVDSE